MNSANKTPPSVNADSMLSPSASPRRFAECRTFDFDRKRRRDCMMIILAFGATGYWLEGAVAAIGGGLSSAYLVRSSFGRIDTDQLNLGLMYLMFGLVMLSARSKTAVSTNHLGCCGRRNSEIFMAWYGKPELIWMAMASYAWLLAMQCARI